MAYNGEPPRFVLFLPPAPTPCSLSALKAAFGDTISQVLKEVASHSSDSRRAAILEVAAAIPELAQKRRSPRSELYQTTQTALAGIYKLICVIAARGGVNVEDADGVDVRVLLVAWSPDESDLEPQYEPYGPVVYLRTLATSGRQWQYAFGVESEAGEAMVRAFVAAKGTGEGISRVSSGSVIKTEQSHTTSDAAKEQNGPTPQSSRRHYHVAVGGTFDHLHIGHKLLLIMTVFAVDEASSEEKQSSERSATIGITGDQLLKNKKHAEVLESWDDRRSIVQEFLESLLNFTTEGPQIQRRDDPGANGKSVDLRYPNGLTVKLTEIQDPFGPTITEEQISALVISGETRSGGKAVNDKRKEKGWAELDVFEVDVLDAEDEGAEVTEGFGSKLSSTAIRQKIASKGGGRAKV